MDIDKFLVKKGIDPAQVVFYHYSENEKGETPNEAIDVDLETLLKEFKSEQTKILNKLIKELESKIQSLKLSGNPEDWMKGSAEEIRLMGIITAKQLIQ